MDVGAAQAGEGRHLLRRPRLADSGLAREQDQLGAAAEGLIGRFAQLRELHLAANEDAAGEALERVLGGATRIVGRRRSVADRLEALADGGGGLGAVLRRLRQQLGDQQVELGVTCGLWREGATGSALRCWPMTATASSPVKGGCPQIIS